MSVMYERLNTSVYMGVDVAYAAMKGFGVEQRRDKIGREPGCGEEEAPHVS